MHNYTTRKSYPRDAIQHRSDLNLEGILSLGEVVILLRLLHSLLVGLLLGQSLSDRPGLLLPQLLGNKFGTLKLLAKLD